MNPEKLGSALTAAARRILEDAAFVFTEEASDPTPESAWSQTVSQACLPFKGPVSGRFMLAASPRLGETLAAEMLGTDPGSPESAEQAEDALREILNMTAGATLEGVFPDELWELSVPEIKRVSPAEHVASRTGAAVWVHLNTEESDPIELAVYLDGATAP
jgi:chemotaxis protein CheY-P-specific phosphatase CheC